MCDRGVPRYTIGVGPVFFRYACNVLRAMSLSDEIYVVLLSVSRSAFQIEKSLLPGHELVGLSKLQLAKFCQVWLQLTSIVFRKSSVSVSIRAYGELQEGELQPYRS